MNALSGPGVTEAVPRGDNSLLNFIGGVILGGPAGFMLGLAAIAIFIGLPLPANDQHHARMALAATAGSIGLLASAALLTAIVIQRGRAFAGGTVLGCLFAAVIWFFVIAASAGTR